MHSTTYLCVVEMVQDSEAASPVDLSVVVTVGLVVLVVVATEARPNPLSPFLYNGHMIIIRNDFFVHISCLTVKNPL